MRDSGSVLLSQELWEETFPARQIIILWRKVEEMRKAEKRVGAKRFLQNVFFFPYPPPSPPLIKSYKNFPYRGFLSVSHLIS